MSKASPLISVVLPVYNARPYLADALRSILAQTESDFELLILNDGSTDGSDDVIAGFSDPRIRYFSHANMGLASTLNKGIEVSRGKYVARQDADDISHPERFAKQIQFLECNPKVLLLGTRSRIMSDEKKTLGHHNHALNHSELAFDLMFDCPFVHSSVMIRKEVFATTPAYNVDRGYCEDFELWSRIARIGDMANLREVLLDYRHHAKGISKTDYYGPKAAMQQCIQNISTFLASESAALHDLAALYHFRVDLYQGSTFADMSRIVSAISRALQKQRPAESPLIRARERQYKKILVQRYLLTKRASRRDGLLTHWLLRARRRLFGRQEYIQNE